VRIHLKTTFLIITFVLRSIAVAEEPNQKQKTQQIERGRYLATIGACAACHTPPAVSAVPPGISDKEQIAKERVFRTDPDWLGYLDPKAENHFAGGVPFYLRLAEGSYGTVYSRNITPDVETGLGDWTDDQIAEVIRSGKRKDGSSLFLFPPHTFYKNLSEEDLKCIVTYLRNQPVKKNKILERTLPFEPAPATELDFPKKAPSGRTAERALYLMDSLVGCRECHSHKNKDGKMSWFTGGDPIDPFEGSFRLGPDLPLRQSDKGMSTFPYPGYAILFGGNLTRFGLNGDRSGVSPQEIVRAIKQGVSTQKDKYGRDVPLAHVMLWQFYASMTDEDAFAIADYLKTLEYIPHDVGPRLIMYGDDWESAFEKAFGEKPSVRDAIFFGKKLSTSP
jgi:hypothetical protein